MVGTSLELRMALPMTGSHLLEGQPAIFLFQLQGQMEGSRGILLASAAVGEGGGVAGTM